MELKYVGPKPIISHTGVEFDNNKDDKFAYLEVAVDLLKALSHDYIEDRTYTYETEIYKLSSEELLHELRKYCPNIDSLMKRENHVIEDEIHHEIQRARESLVLTSIEKEVLENNIEMMHDYLIQRSINKSIYYCAINALAELLKKDHIDHIIAPMLQRFIHVFHSIEGCLKLLKTPIDTKLDIYKKNGQLLVRLQIIHT
ncbi:hypothetical protein KJ877_10285 [bacterium]|nr:hypothetical protein [bacterium]MBU1991121.1 hypothetical protein [bacterium]